MAILQVSGWQFYKSGLLIGRELNLAFLCSSFAYNKCLEFEQQKKKYRKVKKVISFIELVGGNRVIDHPNPFSHLVGVAPGQVGLVLLGSHLGLHLTAVDLQVSVAAQAFEGSLLERAVLPRASLLSQDDDDFLDLLLEEGQSLLDFRLLCLFDDELVQKLHLLNVLGLLLLVHFLAELSLQQLLCLFRQLLDHILQVFNRLLVNLFVVETFHVFGYFRDLEFLFVYLASKDADVLVHDVVLVAHFDDLPLKQFKLLHTECFQFGQLLHHYFFELLELACTLDREMALLDLVDVGVGLDDLAVGDVGAAGVVAGLVDVTVADDGVFYLVDFVDDVGEELGVSLLLPLLLALGETALLPHRVLHGVDLLGLELELSLSLVDLLQQLLVEFLVLFVATLQIQGHFVDAEVGLGESLSELDYFLVGALLVLLQAGEGANSFIDVGESDCQVVLNVLLDPHDLGVDLGDGVLDFGHLIGGLLVDVPHEQSDIVDLLLAGLPHLLELDVEVVVGGFELVLDAGGQGGNGGVELRDVEGVVLELGHDVLDVGVEAVGVDGDFENVTQGDVHCFIPNLEPIMIVVYNPIP